MTTKLRALLVATIISCGGLVAAIAPTTAAAGPTLQIVQGSKEFETLVTAIEVSKQEAIYLQWTTDQAGATGGTWTVKDANGGSKVVASAESGPAPSVGHFARFLIPANAFLLPAPPATPVKFNITIQAHNATPLGNASAAVAVSQVPEGPPTPPIKFGASAVFPAVEIVTLEEKIGVVPQTQLHYAGADVTVRVKNNGFIFKGTTDPMWLVIKDNSLLMRQKTPVSIPSLQPGTAKTLSVHLDAILPPPTSQLPEDKQYSQWSQAYRDRCGVDLIAVMDWRGPQAQTPNSSHLEATVFPNAPICAGNQCVQTCQIARNIHAELDGSVVGYSFFVGLYPKFEANGEARTSANSAKQYSTDFTTKTKITVASVSKIVTAIAAVRILDKHGVSLDAKIGSYLPSDWNTRDSILSKYVYDITFAQLLGQRSGIKDYGNVPNDYATLKKFYSQAVSDSATTACDPRDSNGNYVSVALGQGFTPNNTAWCYSNFNFAIIRILLPKVAGFAEDSDQSTRPQTLADQYVALVQQNVFDLVGQKGVECKPPSQAPGILNYAFAYNYLGNTKGFDWGDNTLICGAAGWYLSVEDIARVLLSINARDGKIFSTKPDQFDDLRNRGLGLDIDSATEMEKNGSWSANCDSNGKNCATISTSVAIFGPVTGPRVIGVLFLNSNISGGPSNAGTANLFWKKPISVRFRRK